VANRRLKTSSLRLRRYCKTVGHIVVAVAGTRVNTVNSQHPSLPVFLVFFVTVVRQSICLDDFESRRHFIAVCNSTTRIAKTSWPTVHALITDHLNCKLEILFTYINKLALNTKQSFLLNTSLEYLLARANVGGRPTITAKPPHYPW